MRIWWGLRFTLQRRRGRLLQDALVMVMDGDGEGLLGVLLADAGQIELALDLGGLGNAAVRLVLLDLGGEFLVQDLFAERDAVVADENAGALDELLHLGV